ncbi:Uncharacterised protein [Vibrio cholerae]|nr:Uncharacterised protein [Vibrio cholerae]
MHVTRHAAHQTPLDAASFLRPLPQTLRTRARDRSAYPDDVF